jgi:hypothetical protein
VISRTFGVSFLHLRGATAQAMGTDSARIAVSGAIRRGSGDARVTLSFVASSAVPPSGREAAAEIVRRTLEATKVPGVVLHDPVKQADWTLALLDQANSEIIRVHKVGANVASCTLVILVNDRATLGHVGNTSAYFMDAKGQHIRWTTEHTIDAALRASGLRLPSVPGTEAVDTEELLRCLGGKLQIEKGYLQGLETTSAKLTTQQRWTRLEPGQAIVLAAGATALDMAAVVGAVDFAGVAEDPKFLAREIVQRSARLDPTVTAASAVVSRPVGREEYGGAVG